jgi:hypothetical protein
MDEKQKVKDYFEKQITGIISHLRAVEVKMHEGERKGSELSLGLIEKIRGGGHVERNEIEASQLLYHKLRIYNLELTETANRAVVLYGAAKGVGAEIELREDIQKQIDDIVAAAGDNAYIFKKGKSGLIEPVEPRMWEYLSARAKREAEATDIKMYEERIVSEYEAWVAQQDAQRKAADEVAEKAVAPFEDVDELTENTSGVEN